MAEEVVVALARADGGIEQGGVPQVVLATQGTEGVLGAGVGPGLGEVVVDVLRVGHLDPGVQADPLHGAVHVTGLPPEVEGQAHALGTQVEPEHGGVAVQVLVVPFGVAGLLHTVEAQAEALVLAEAPADVHVTAQLPGGGLHGGEFGDRVGPGALGLDVDRAADAAVGRQPAEQCAWALEHVHPLDHLHVDGIGGQHAVQAAEGDIAVVEAVATDGELLEAPRRGVGAAHRGVAGDQVGQGAGLLVLHHLAGVGGLAQGRFQEVPLAQQPEAAAARHLPAGVGIAAHPDAFAGDGDGRQLLGPLGTRRQALQGVAPLPGRQQHQPRAPQQGIEAFVDAVFTLQPGAVEPVHQGRVHGQAHAGLAGETGQGTGQAARRYLVCAPGTVIGPGAGQAEGQEKAGPQQVPGQGEGRGTGGHGRLSFSCCLLG